jgi:hypothetical protein
MKRKLGMEYAGNNSAFVCSLDAKSFGTGTYKMVCYEPYWRDPIKGYQLIGVLPERRTNPKKTKKKSVLIGGKNILVTT